MSKFHLQEVSSIARWYDTEDGYEKKIPFRAICSVTWLGDTHVFIHGMLGKLGKQDMKELFLELQSKGVTHVMAERKGKFVTRDIDLLLSKANRKESVVETT